MKLKIQSNYYLLLFIFFVAIIGISFFSMPEKAYAIPDGGDGIEINNDYSPTDRTNISVYCSSINTPQDCKATGRIDIGQLYSLDSAPTGIDPSGNQQAGVSVCINTTGEHWTGACWDVSYREAQERHIDLNNDGTPYNYLTMNVRVDGEPGNLHWHRHAAYGYGRHTTLDTASSSASSIGYNQEITLSTSGSYGKDVQIWVIHPDNSEYRLGTFAGNMTGGFDASVNYSANGTRGPGTYKFEFSAYGPKSDRSWARIYKTINVNVTAPPAPTANIQCKQGSSWAGACTWNYGSNDYIKWSSTNATSCTVSPPSWSGTSGQERTGNLTSTTTFTVNCSGLGGSISDSVIVTVNPPSPTVDIQCKEGSYVKDSCSWPYNTNDSIIWSSTNATSCTISPSGWTGTSGTRSTGALTTTTTYTASCTGSGGSGSDSVTVTVSANPPPSVSISANPTSVVSGGSSTITWSSSNTTSCTVSPTGWTGLNQSLSYGPLTSTVTLTLTCAGPGGSASDSVTITVEQAESEITFTVAYSSSLNSPTITAVHNHLTDGTVPSGSLRTDWSYTSNGVEQGFRLYRSTVAGSAGALVTGSIGAAARTYTDSPAQDASYYYTVCAYTNIPSPNEACSNQYGPVYNPIDSANLNNSSMILYEVCDAGGSNCTAWTGSGNINNGDLLRFRVIINNAGPGIATISKICTVPSSNIVNLRNLSLIGGGSSSGITANAADCSNNWRLNVSGAKPVGGSNWIAQFDSTFSSQTEDNYEICTNNGAIYYSDGTGLKTKSVSYGPSLCKTGKKKAPKFQEIIP
jgi:hypothetical protein